jgi:hypothetical protein
MYTGVMLHIIEIYRVLPRFGPTTPFRGELPSSPTPTAPSSGVTNRAPLLGKTLNMAKVVAFNMKRHRRDLNRPPHTPQFN